MKYIFFLLILFLISCGEEDYKSSLPKTNPYFEENRRYSDTQFRNNKTQTKPQYTRSKNKDLHGNYSKKLDSNKKILQSKKHANLKRFKKNQKECLGKFDAKFEFGRKYKYLKQDYLINCLSDKGWKYSSFLDKLRVKFAEDIGKDSGYYKSFSTDENFKKISQDRRICRETFQVKYPFEKDNRYLEQDVTIQCLSEKGWKYSSYLDKLRTSYARDLDGKYYKKARPNSKTLERRSVSSHTEKAQKFNKSHEACDIKFESEYPSSVDNAYLRQDFVISCLVQKGWKHSLFLERLMIRFTNNEDVRYHNNGSGKKIKKANTNSRMFRKDKSECSYIFTSTYSSNEFLQYQFLKEDFIISCLAGKGWKYSSFLDNLVGEYAREGYDSNKYHETSDYYLGNAQNDW